MLVSAFLLLGCLAFALIIGSFVPKKLRDTVIVWMLVSIGLWPYLHPQTAFATASAFATVYAICLVMYGSHAEREAAKKAEQDRTALVEAIRREQFSLPPAPGQGRSPAS